MKQTAAYCHQLQNAQHFLAEKAKIYAKQMKATRNGYLKVIGYFVRAFQIQNHQKTFPDAAFLIEQGPKTSGIEDENDDQSGDETDFDDNFSVATKELSRRTLTMNDSELESDTSVNEHLRCVLHIFDPI